LAKEDALRFSAGGSHVQIIPSMDALDDDELEALVRGRRT
jgi:hypothetical protein